MNKEKIGQLENVSNDNGAANREIPGNSPQKDKGQDIQEDRKDDIILKSSRILKGTQNKFTRRPWQLTGIFAGAAVHMATGVMVGLTGIILPSLLNPKLEDIQLNKNQAYMFSSIVSGGAIAGSVISGPLMVWLGQRISLLIFLPIGIVSWLFIAFTQSIWLLILSRFTSGLLLGVGTVCANNYVVEITHKKVKGRGVAALDCARQVGYLFVYLVGSTSMTWRSVSMICGLSTCIIPFLLLLFLHDSPRWLATKDRKEDSAAALQFFRGKNTDVSQEYEEIISKTTNSAKSVWDEVKLMTESHILKVFILSMYLSFASHFTGNLITIMYSATIFKASNTGIDAYTSTIIMGSSRIVGTVIYIFCADKFPKRSLFTIPLSMAGFCMTLLGVFFYLQDQGIDVGVIFWLPLVSIIVYGCLTCISLPVLMVLRSELIPNSVRPIAGSLLFVAFNTGAFVATQSFPYMIELIGSHWTFWIFAANNILLVIVVLLFIPETQGKSLEEIEEILRKGLCPKFFHRNSSKGGSPNMI